jgi:hypothetical protein
MEQQKGDLPNQLTATKSVRPRRRECRVNSHLNLTFSGMLAKLMFVERGVVTDMCQNGLGIHADGPVKAGMDLALFIECPDSEDYVCIPEARVTWANGDRFGVSIRMIKPDDQERLHKIFALARREPSRVS